MSADAVRLYIRQRQKPLDLSALSQADQLQSVNQQPVQLQRYDQLLPMAHEGAVMTGGANGFA